ncbi:MAG: enoyl-CoA hydratase/isomerase family protein [Desulfurellaceae bacterium]|nr:enoyl-CoA hydratase/isomerase family protein [Desulfurellaceae bacterium]
MPRHFLLEKEDRIATLTFNRPEKRNPLNEDILLELDALLCRLRDDTGVRVLIFTGAGNSFCAGADLSLIKGVDDPHEREAIFQEFAPRRTRLTERVLASLVHLEPITIAAVNGYAVGGGWGLVLGCDLCVAVEGAEFWFPEVDLGAPLSPAMTTLLAAQVGPARAKEMMLTCCHYTANELLSLGMLNQVVTPDKLMPTVTELARSLAAKNANALMVSKATVNAVPLHRAVIRPDLLLGRD